MKAQLLNFAAFAVFGFVCMAAIVKINPVFGLCLLVIGAGIALSNAGMPRQDDGR